MIDLVITHFTHPWGPLGPWKPLVTLGDPWRPCLKVVKMAKIPIFRHGRQGSPRVIINLLGLEEKKQVLYK